MKYLKLLFSISMIIITIAMLLPGIFPNVMIHLSLIAITTIGGYIFAKSNVVHNKLFKNRKIFKEPIMIQKTIGIGIAICSISPILSIIGFNVSF